MPSWNMGVKNVDTARTFTSWTAHLGNELVPSLVAENMPKLRVDWIDI
jgi:hypothetical protein